MRTLRLWVLPNQGFDTLAGIRAALAPFLRRRAGERLEITVRTASSLWRYLFLELKRAERAGDGAGADGTQRPDIVEIPAHWTSTFAHLGLLEDLCELGATDLGSWQGLLRPLCLKSGTPQVYSLPWWMEVWVLYYRKDEWRRRGLHAAALSSWEGLSDACRALARVRPGAAILPPIANHNPRGSVSLADVAPAVWAHGGDFFSPDGARSLLHRPETQAGLGSYLDLIHTGAMPLLGRRGLAPVSIFEGGSCLQFWGRRPRGRRRGGALGAVPLPGAGGRAAGLITASHLAIMRGTPWAREAFELLQEMTRPDAARAYAQTLGAFPCVPEWAQGCFRGSEELKEAFEAAAAPARTLPPLPQTATLERILDRSLDLLVDAMLRRRYQDEDLRQGLLYAAAEMDSVLAFYGSGLS